MIESNRMETEYCKSWSISVDNERTGIKKSYLFDTVLSEKMNQQDVY